MIRIRLVSDLDKKGLEEAQRGLEKLKGIADSSFRAVAAGAGIAAIGIGKFAFDSIKAASDLEESTNAVNVAFGKSAKAVLEVGANSAESLGLARNEFNAAAVRFSAFAERIVGAGGDASTFIAEVSQRASDFASVFNIEVSEALQVFQSGLAGEAEPLKRFGINLLQSEVQAFALRDGIVAIGEQMTETQKVQARYGLLLESTAKTAGDFANTSDGLANSQRILKARFTDLQAEIGQALLPAFTELFKAVADRVMPELEALGEFLKSPDGQKAIADFANTVGDLAVKFLENFDEIMKVVGTLAIFTTGVKLATTAVGLATTAQLLFNTAVKLNPYVLAATGLLAFVAAVTMFRTDADKAALSVQKQAYQVDILKTEIDRLNDTYRVGAIDQETYDNQLRVLEQRMNSVKISTEGTAGEMARFNALSLASVRKEMESTASVGARLARNQRELYFAMRGQVAPEMGTAFDEPTKNAVISSGPSAFEQARERVQSLIQSSQKQLQDSQKRYNESVRSARENYANNILNIERDFAGRLAGIIQGSQDRLRSAYRSAVEENIAALFDRSEDKSIDALVKSLSDKLTASRSLLANSAQLASQGFSQTFIEQVVSAGVETGNELAAAILQSTPETQAELRSLFSAIETEAGTGMDSLAKEIYSKQGLATAELKNLYVQTGKELELALFDQQKVLAKALEDSATALYDSVKEIRTGFEVEIDKMGTKLGGMLKTIELFKKALGITEGKALTDALNAATMPGGSFTTGGVTTAVNEVKNASGILIDSVEDIADVYDYLGQRARAAETYLSKGNLTNAQRLSASATLAELRASQSTIYSGVKSDPSGLVGTVININVKADTSQSLAMVGKSLGNTVAKYVTGGGQVIVSPV